MIEIPNFQQEDAGLYECITENSRGKNIARGRLTYYGRKLSPPLLLSFPCEIKTTLGYFWVCSFCSKHLCLKIRGIHLRNGDLLHQVFA